MSRPDRWWRPATRRRPPQRARQRRMYTGRELDGVFDSGYAAGYADGVTRRESADDADQQWRQDLEDIRRAYEADPERVRELADAVEEGGDAVRRLAERWGIRPADGLLDVAEAAGVTPLADVDPGELVADLEAWLRDGGE